jgi:hypothetical protein
MQMPYVREIRSMTLGDERENDQVLEQIENERRERADEDAEFERVTRKPYRHIRPPRT